MLPGWKSIKGRLEKLLAGSPSSIRYNDHQIGHGPAFHKIACEHGLEGVVSKRVDGRYEPDRRSWLKIKCQNHEEFEWTPDGLLRHVVYLGEREDKPARGG